MKEEELVTALIADHLRHLKLMSGLEKMGFDALDYYLGLPEVIFKIMNIESETVFLYYITAAELMCEKKEAVKVAAETLYEDLVRMREEIH